MNFLDIKILNMIFDPIEKAFGLFVVGSMIAIEYVVEAPILGAIGLFCKGKNKVDSLFKSFPTIQSYEDDTFGDVIIMSLPMFVVGLFAIVAIIVFI